MGQFGPYATAHKDGVLKGVLLIKFDGRSDLLRESDLFFYAVDSKKVGHVVSLHLTEMLSNKDKAFQDGIKYLIKIRKEDGSWFVKSRSKPFQTYYESGFPHGKDQFISVAASGWATTALLLSLAE